MTVLPLYITRSTHAEPPEQTLRLRCKCDRITATVLFVCDHWRTCRCGHVSEVRCHCARSVDRGTTTWTFSRQATVKTRTKKSETKDTRWFTVPTRNNGSCTSTVRLNRSLSVFKSLITVTYATTRYSEGIQVDDYSGVAEERRRERESVRRLPTAEEVQRNG